MTYIDTTRWNEPRSALGRYAFGYGDKPPGFWFWVILILMLFFILRGFVHEASARDLGQWAQNDPKISEWFKSLKRPDIKDDDKFTIKSCCGTGDGWETDLFEQKDGQYVAIITDERDDAPLQRPHLPAGTRVVVPNEKILKDNKNPTGHGYIFLYVNQETIVSIYCYIPPAGI